MEKRFKCALLSILFVLSAVLGRCAYISLDKSYTVSDSYNSYTLTLGTLYTNIYDRKGSRLNNCAKATVAVIPPNEKALAELEKLFSDDECKSIREELKKGIPVTKTVTKKADTANIKQYEIIIENTDDMPARHMLDKMCGGLEYYTDEEIGSLCVNFHKDATGRLLESESFEVIDDDYSSNEGIIVSLDKDIQHIAEAASKGVKKGAVVVMDTNTSQVLASVSRGDDYINRAVYPYAVGSVFKIIVSACALENNINQIYYCNGYTDVGDTRFHCLNNKKHGILDMKTALENSCNCYFAKLALKLGEDKLLKTAKDLGFGKEFQIYDNFVLSAGSFPSLQVLDSDGQLALTGFGQGALSDSPVHFASALSAVVNGGYYNPPTLDISDSSNNRVLSENSSEKLRDYMTSVVRNGTGVNANYKNLTGGKTATAQSGIYINGKEVLNTWFAGFYPADKPEYTIVVMTEGGTTGSEDCCPVFRTIVEMLEKK